MTEQDILGQMTEILQGLLFDDTIALNKTTLRSDIPEWDSFAYVNFTVAVEMEFNIKFGVAEIESFKNVGEIVDRVLELVKS